MRRFLLLLFVSGCEGCRDEVALWPTDDASDAPLEGAPSDAGVKECNGLDDDNDWAIDEGCRCPAEDMRRPCGIDWGACEQGEQLCSDGIWHGCGGLVGPTEEVCNTIDDDCDGTEDEGCACKEEGSERRCGSNIGACEYGIQRCTEAIWTNCDGSVAPTSDACNGIDDDCDGTTDPGCACENDGTVRGCGVTTVGTCEMGRQECTEGYWGLCVGDHGPTADICNGFDDDCDGTIDPGCPCSDEVASRACGIDMGACEIGTQTCEKGLWSTCQGNIGPTAESCNSFDDDCDGETDERCPCKEEGARITCGTNEGACTYGQQVCTDGSWSHCEARVTPIGEICNGLDDDCDRETDVGCPCDGEGPTLACGRNTGTCAFGVHTCRRGLWSPCEGDIGPTQELCNGLNDDCDNETDEGCPCNDSTATLPCGSNTGLCRQGEQVCRAGAWSQCEGGIGPTPELCNDVDDDCDDEKDVDCTCTEENATRACGSDVGACTLGEQTCTNGGWTACEGGIRPAPEVCNQVDDDCDEYTDELPAIPCDGSDTDLCLEGILACTEGVLVCTDDTASTWETCNGEDDDCDGETDNGHLASPLRCDGDDLDLCLDGLLRCIDGRVQCSDDSVARLEVCNGCDDDCDAQVDEDFGLCTSCCDSEEDADLCEDDNLTCDGCVDVAGDAIDLCYDGFDGDCDGDTDEGCGDCGDEICIAPENADICPWDCGCFAPLACGGEAPGGCYCDDTCGLYGDCCRDSCLACGVGGPELCDGIDNDCDDHIDEDCSSPDNSVECWRCGDGRCDIGETATNCGGDCGCGAPGACGDIAPFGCRCDAQCLTTGTCCPDACDECREIIASPEVCDGWDNDCDGVRDPPCCPEVCNGRDDDCDDDIDEGLPNCPCAEGETRWCGIDVGLCVPGIERCESVVCPEGEECPSTRWIGVCDGSVGPTTETCNGEDDDCDGTRDNGFSCPNGSIQFCGVTSVGECEFGRRRCEDCEWTDCVGAVDPREEVCEGEHDEDCDGFIDNGCPCITSEHRNCSVDVGVCRIGTQYCVASGWSDVCEGGILPSPEVCNGLDDDCDGLPPDEDFECTEDTLRDCGIPIGACQPGSQLCSDCMWQDCTAPMPTEEACGNAIDDDCDTHLDMRRCGTDIGECEAGWEYCDGDSWTGICVGGVGPSPEICDSKDNDCDGDPDNGLPLECVSAAIRSCGTTNLGNCRFGTQLCNDRCAWEACGDAIDPLEETCGNGDEDCDGIEDDGNNSCGGACTLEAEPGSVCDVTGTIDLDFCFDDRFECSGPNVVFCVDIDTDNDGDGYSVGSEDCVGDCNDDNAAISPGAIEICGDNIDNNCLDGADEGDNACGGCATLSNTPGTTCDTDADLDSCPDDSWECLGRNVVLCANAGVDADSDGFSVGSADCNGDCDDANAGINPGAGELCNGIDEDCRDGADNGFPVGEGCDGPDADRCEEGAWECDPDNGQAVRCTDTTDDTLEICDGNNAPNDEDCDGRRNEECDCVDGTPIPCSNNIGVCREGTQTCSGGRWGDCTGVLPTDEVCNNSDDNCDGRTDNQHGNLTDNGCAGVCSLTNAPNTACDTEGTIGDRDTCTHDQYVCDGFSTTRCAEVDTDNDNDGYSGGSSDCNGDCNDDDPAIHPGAIEICGDDIDNNCLDGADEGNNACGGCATLPHTPGDACDVEDVDGDDLDDCPDDMWSCAGRNAVICTNSVDTDGDGYSAGPASCSGDCDDTIETGMTRYPGNTEVCDGLDNDCDCYSETTCADTQIDEATPSFDNGCGGVCPLPIALETVCDAEGATGDLDTCTDDQYVCDGLNNTRCADNDYDDDNDGYSEGPSNCNGDCIDDDPAINPGATEICGDNIDNNCRDGVDEGTNDCGGCATLPNTPETACDEDADLDDCPDDRWECSGQNAVVCTDGGYDDRDGDGYSAYTGPENCEKDCDDDDGGRNPGRGEICNGIDEDCRDGPDNGFPVGRPCDGPDADRCEEGVWECDPDNGQAVRCTDTTDDTLEICDGNNPPNDEDCDGRRNEECDCVDGTPIPCSNNIGVCREGTQTCSGGRWGDCTGVLPTDEVCNNLDDNCDGTTDNQHGTLTDNGCRGVCPLTNAPDTVCDTEGTTGDLDTCTDDKYVCDDLNTTRCAEVDTDNDNDGYSAGPLSCDGDCNDFSAVIKPGDGCECVVGETRPCGIGCISSCVIVYDEEYNEGHYWERCPPSDYDHCNGNDDNCNGLIDDGTENLCGGSCELGNNLEDLADPAHCDFTSENEGVELDWCRDDRHECTGLNSHVCVDVDNDSDDDGYSLGDASCDGDCDDTSAGRYPRNNELCDGIDNDCDNDIDEADEDAPSNGCGGVCDLEYSPGTACDAEDRDACLDDRYECLDLNAVVCVDVDTDADNDTYSACIDCDDFDAGRFPGNPEICDGKDNNCDNRRDEGFTCTVGDIDLCPGNPYQGICYPGTHECVLGCRWSACEGVIGPEPVDTCGNGIDENCENGPDEGCPCSTNGKIRRCPSSPDLCEPGYQTCMSGSWSSCEGVVRKSPERCTPEDEDCDRDPYNGFWPRPGAPCDGQNDTDSCQEGIWTCTSDGADVYCSDTTDNTPEDCDTSEDDDCNGTPNDPTTCPCISGAICGSSIGACEQGIAVCEDGRQVRCDGAVTDSEEICDGLDNNCNHDCDEDFGCCNGTSQECWPLGACVPGTQRCSSCQWGACEGAQYCGEGSEDDGGELGGVQGLCSNGLESFTRRCDGSNIGECRSGNQRCTNGYWGLCEGRVRPMAERCDDGKDNDCDGSKDEGCHCVNGNTQDCDYVQKICVYHSYDPEGNPTGETCTDTIVGPGRQWCESDRWSNCRSVGSSGAEYAVEVCNGFDDDYDGLVDEWVADCCMPGTDERDCELGPGCPPGIQICEDYGIWSRLCLGRPGTSFFDYPDPCDGLDNNCNGIIDEDPCPQTNPRAIAECRGGRCENRCSYPYADCEPPDGDCETNTRTSVFHCGGCTRQCVRTNAYTACDDGKCTIIDCLPGYGDCDEDKDKDESNGCEVDLSLGIRRWRRELVGGVVELRTVVDYCGSCEVKCDLPHAHATCVADRCAIFGCPPGYEDCTGCLSGYRDCNRSPADGCEVNLKSDPYNCGACRQRCLSASNPGLHLEFSRCESGRCVNACEGPDGVPEWHRLFPYWHGDWADCDRGPYNGCERPLNTNENCAGCNDNCTAQGSVCNSAILEPGFKDCMCWRGDILCYGYDF